MGAVTAADRARTVVTPRLSGVFVALTFGMDEAAHGPIDDVGAAVHRREHNRPRGSPTAFEVSRWDQRSATDIHNSIRCSTASPGSTSLSYRSASSAYWS
jgi:hypothetical protein